MNSAILISIHPEHIGPIMSGKKVFEYRKSLPKHEIKKMVLYATAPISKIVGIADVEGVITDTPKKVWKKTSAGGGISKSFYEEYYRDRTKANVFKIGKVYELTRPLSLAEFSKPIHVPQSYSYLDSARLKKINRYRRKDAQCSNICIFVGGIHGVGKTTMCSRFLEPLGFRSVTASSLIYKGKSLVGKDKRVSDVDGNQRILLDQFDREKSKSNRLVMDGHFTLVNSTGNIEPIDTKVFEGMGLNAMFLMRHSPLTIYERLLKRDGVKWSMKQIEDFQSKEKQHAKFVSQELGIPLSVIDCSCTTRSIRNNIEVFLWQ